MCHKFGRPETAWPNREPFRLPRYRVNRALSQTFDHYSFIITSWIWYFSSCTSNLSPVQIGECMLYKSPCSAQARSSKQQKQPIEEKRIICLWMKITVYQPKNGARDMRNSALSLLASSRRCAYFSLRSGPRFLFRVHYQRQDFRKIRSLFFAFFSVICAKANRRTKEKFAIQFMVIFLFLMWQFECEQLFGYQVNVRTFSVVAAAIVVGGGFVVVAHIRTERSRFLTFRIWILLI